MKFALTFFAFVIFSAFGQDTKADAILSKLSTKLNSHSSFYIEYTVNIKNEATGTDENNSGKGWVKGNKYHASFGDNTIISNGKKTWTIVKEEKAVYESDADEDDDESINPKRLMTIWENGFKSKYGKETTLNGKTADVIYLYPKNPSEQDYHTVVLYISKKNNELSRVVLRYKDGTIMTFKLLVYKENPTVNDSKFVFNRQKYPGYPVVKD